MAKKVRRRGTASASIGLELVDGDVLIEQLDRLQVEVGDEIAKKAIAAALQPIESTMISIAPESTGSREKQSKSTRTKWQNTKKLKTTIRSVVREKRRAGIFSGIVGLVGPSYSDGGGHGNLFARDHARKVLWGRDSGSVRKVNQFVKKSADQTRARANQILRNVVKAEIEKFAKQK